jgi:hypothetical protein
MSRRCQSCGAVLSSYNNTQLCFPCLQRKKEFIESKLMYSRGFRSDYICDLLDGKKRPLNRSGDLRLNIQT